MSGELKRQSGSDEGDFALEDGLGGGGAIARARAGARAGYLTAGDDQRAGTGHGRPARAAEFQLAGYCDQACRSAGDPTAACNRGRSTQCGCDRYSGSGAAGSEASRDPPGSGCVACAAAGWQCAVYPCCFRCRIDAVSRQLSCCGTAAFARTSSIGFAGTSARRTARTRAQAFDPALASRRRCARCGHLVPPLASAPQGGAGGGTGIGRICPVRAGAVFAASTASSGSRAASIAATGSDAATSTQTGTAGDERHRRLALAALARNRNAAAALSGRRQPGHDRVRG